MTIAGKQEANIKLVKSRVFDPEHFIHFCDNLVIDTKEKGKQKLKLLGTQKYYIQEIAKGLSEGQHWFVVLKGRQLGLSTVSLALDLYWNFLHPGTQGSLVTDTDENRNNFRTMLSMYIDNLDKRFKVPVKAHNRMELTFRNTSRLAYLVAGTKKNSSLGTGKAINFLHATECSSWGDDEGFRNLLATLAETNPHRFYVFESTARGYNLFHEMWETAKESRFQRAIFIGWWRNEIYRKERNTAEFNVYWDGHLTVEEAKWVSDIKELYDFDIQPEQIAWWRFKLAEEIQNENQMYQEYPPTEEYAFQMTGSKFFSTGSLNRAREEVNQAREAMYYCYQSSSYVETLRLVECEERDAELTVWEPPESGVQYVIGADPAYGSSENADRFVASIWKCYADKLVQVAEYATPDSSTHQFAWILAHLCGVYSGALLNLEMTGPGQSVFSELQSLTKFPPNARHCELNDVAGNIRHYLYRRQDTMGGGFAYQWMTNQREKERMLNTYRDYFERGMLEIRSPDLLNEMRVIVRDGGWIGGDGDAKDDRVMACGLSVIGWHDWLLHDLMLENVTQARMEAQKELEGSMTTLQRLYMNFMSNALSEPSDGDFYDLG